MKVLTLLSVAALSATVAAVALATGAAPAATAANAVRLVPFKAAARMVDTLQMPQPWEVRLQGYLGTRVANNEKKRLLVVDEEELLAGFRKRPGKQAWIGEHVGKFLHAATLGWAYSGDAALRAKIDRVVVELIKTQEADGYLGTYVPEKRFALERGSDWDVWVHKYNLIGLLTYYHYTGNAAALDASRKMADLLLNTFGPGKKSILAAGTHVGMASTSVLEPLVLLYRLTGEQRYLDFSRYIVQSWDEPRGPQIIKTLLAEKSVAKTANSKAYEMLSNLVGLCELARATGEQRFLEPVQIAWEDIVANHLYITGSASQGEHFHENHQLPNNPDAHLGETCVTVTWIQLNAQLLRLTGQARFGNELERSYYNHLAAAQRPDGAEWCYYTALEGTKPYGASTNCCLSSGPRGMALLPQLAYLRLAAGNTPAGGADSLAVNFFETSQARLALGGQQVAVQQRTGFPLAGSSTLSFRMQRPAVFGLLIRSPAWASSLRARIGRAQAGATRDGWLTIAPRRWNSGDTVQVSFDVPRRLVMGDYSNTGRAALAWGPILLAYDTKANPQLPPPSVAALAEADPVAAFRPKTGGAAGGAVGLAVEAQVRTPGSAQPRTAVFVPFAEAGADGGRYQVWLRAPGTPLPQNMSLLAVGQESRSRPGNVTGATNDGEMDTFVATFDGTRHEEDWFAVTLDAPATIRRVVYAHGKNFHDGGWFDASAGKPRIQAQTRKDGAWETVGTLDEYPATRSASTAGIKAGQVFTLRLPAPRQVVAVRVIGKPASGDNPNQAFSTCAELQAFAD